MKELNIVTPLISVTYDELSPDDRRLVDAAKKMTYRAYAP